MRSSELHRPIRRRSEAGGELTRSVFRIQLGQVLVFTLVVLVLNVLGIAGCTTVKPQVASPVPSTSPHSVVETPRPPAGSASLAAIEENPSVAQMRAWYRAVQEEAAGQVRGITRAEWTCRTGA